MNTPLSPSEAVATLRRRIAQLVDSGLSESDAVLYAADQYRVPLEQARYFWADLT